MHIYLLNWRDMKHPRSGGAEVLTHGVFRRLVERGHRVTWFSGAFRGGAREETVDGIHIVRGGNAVTVRAHAYWYFRSLGGADLIVDEVNTLPFFTPLYANVPVVAFICQLAREVWFFEARRGAAEIGHLLEPLMLRPYANLPVMTISASSAQSLSELGFKGRQAIMPMAITQYDAPAPLPLDKRDQTLVVLGRVTPSKRLEQSIHALGLLPEQYRSIRLAVVGDGSAEERRRLMTIANEVGVANRIDWHGFVSEEHKRALLAKSRALVMTSVREGWGLAVTEANLAGTPAVAYRVPGLRDSVQHEKTGVLTAESPRGLAEGLSWLFADNQRYLNMAAAAQAAARTLSWDATTDFTETFLSDVLQHAKGAA